MYYHPDPAAFEARVREEAERGIAWLRGNVPALRQPGSETQDE